MTATEAPDDSVPDLAPEILRRFLVVYQPGTPLRLDDDSHARCLKAALTATDEFVATGRIPELP